MKVSDKGIQLIRQFEGLSLEAYPDQKGISTIGFGTIQYPNGTKVKLGDKCTEKQAEAWLAFEVNEKCAYFNQVLGYLNLNLSQNQYDALASFFYNCGIGKCKKGTTMGDAIHSKDLNKIANAFLVYNKITVKILGISVKKISKGLDNRRKEEHKLFIEGKDA